MKFWNRKTMLEPKLNKLTHTCSERQEHKEKKSTQFSHCCYADTSSTVRTQNYCYWLLWIMKRERERGFENLDGCVWSGKIGPFLKENIHGMWKKAAKVTLLTATLTANYRNYRDVGNWEVWTFMGKGYSSKGRCTWCELYFCDQ